MGFFSMNPETLMRLSCETFSFFPFSSIKVFMEDAVNKNTMEPSSKSFEELSGCLEEHGDYLLCFSLVHVNDSSTAEDLVQEAYLSAAKSIHSFERRSSPKTWLRSILRNKIIDHYRKQSRDKSEEYVEDISNERLDDFGKFGIWKKFFDEWKPLDPEKTLEQKRLYQAYQSCMSQLPEKFREVFILRVVDGLSVKEICNILPLTSSNISVRLHRARFMLRDCLTKNWYSTE